jgi:putative endonuclease
MKNENYYVYMLTNRNNKVIYVNMINDRAIQTFAHTSSLIEGYTQEHKVNKLVYYEAAADISAAIEREKEIKNLKREKKNRLIEKMNPEWIDLMHHLIK